MLGAVYMNIGVFGGDLRQVHLFELLKKQYEHVDLLYNRTLQKNCCANYDVILLPLPVSKDHVHLFAPYAQGPIVLEHLFQQHSAARFLGGCISNTVREIAARHNVALEDYYQDEALLQKNAVLTADGALKLLEGALQMKPAVLVIGYGRIGKALCSRLQSGHIPFCVTARKEKDFKSMEALGYQGYETGKIKDIINAYSILINTVPYPVLGETELEQCKADCQILDLASAPYGTDFKYCDKRHIAYNIAPGIPGKYYPARAAEAIFETVEQFLKK